jgi:ERF superfamily
MHRSSESVAALAAALATAQAKLVNPEKSLTATIRTGRPGEGERSFRYAPLSSGLDIVRKTLGQHEIATVQTTAIDRASGIVNLTTMLAHASGEWIASDWPVCLVSEMVSPQRMGSALTYARRYALFTLVGIAGEDDLDAPDIQDAAPSSGPDGGGSVDPIEQQSLSRFPPRTSGNGHGRGRIKVAGTAVLDPNQSAALRDKLLAEVFSLAAADQAATWARGALTSKNSLTAADAKLVETGFEQRLAELSPAAATDASPGAEGVKDARVTGTGDQPEMVAAARGHQPGGIDKSGLAVPAPRRYRHKAHLRYVAQQPCLVCGRKPSDPHHLRFMQPPALGRKASDEFAVPLCRIHHRLVHRVGNEATWWNEAGIDPIAAARKLWGRTRRVEGREGTSPHEFSQSAGEQDRMLPPGGGDSTPP